MRDVTTLSLLFVILLSPAASQPPTLAEQPLVIEGRVLWIDFGSETLMLAPVLAAECLRSSLAHRRLPWLANARGWLGQLLPILAAKLQRGSVRISAAISWPRVTTARAIAATMGS